MVVLACANDSVSAVDALKPEINMVSSSGAQIILFTEQ